MSGNKQPLDSAALSPISSEKSKPWVTRLYSWLRKQPLFSRRRSRSIVDRVLGLILVWGLIVFVLAVVGIWFGSTHVIEDNFSYQAKEWVDKLDEIGTPLYTSKNSEEFRSIREHLSRFPEISYVRYYEAENNTVIAEYKSERAQQYVIPVLKLAQLEWLRIHVDAESPLMIETADNDISLIQSAAPIVVRSMKSIDILDFSLDDEATETYKVIGFVEVGLDFSNYREQLIQNISVGGLAILALFVLTAIIGRILIKNALSPLTELKKPLARLADGDIDVYVDSQGDEEIQAIANALNTTISALKNRDKKLRKLANFDTLTGLLNKHNFHIQLKQEFDRIEKENDSSALLFIDLDQFKYINDTLGHAAGDRLLAQIADLLNNRMREQDVIARFGGDEFTVIAKSVSEQDAESIAHSLVKSMQDFVFIENDQSFNVYCSIGVVMMSSKDFSVEEIFSQADMACFQAKSKGRNRYHLFDAEEREEIRKAADIGWSKRLTEALQYDSFRLHFQPIVSLKEDKTEYYEVLVRLKEDEDIMYPNAFLPVAERLGTAVDIDYWVIRNAFKKLSVFNSEGRQVRLSINLSGRVFEAPDLIDKVKIFADKYQVKTTEVIFEITEQTAVRQIDRAKQRIEELNELGFQFALDDFGVGFSSFNYLKHLPVDYLKIDGDFIKNIANDPVDQAMVKSMIQIAKTLNKQIVAEYVQDEKTLELLESFGADYVQGFYLGMPTEETDKDSYASAFGRTPSNVIQF